MASQLHWAVRVSSRARFTERSHSRHLRREWLWLTALLLAASAALCAFNGLGRIDQTLYDRSLDIYRFIEPADQIAATSPIVIVAIDDASVAVLGRWPWRRALHAALIDRLSEAKAVGIDIIFSEPEQQYPDDDRHLGEALARHGRVVLPYVSTGVAHGPPALRPVAQLEQSASAMGFINLHADPDGVVRALPSIMQGHFALALAHIINPALKESDTQDMRLIPFLGSSHAFQIVSYLDVLRGDVPPAFFRNRLVLLGTYATALGDFYPTPLSHQDGAMPGVEILANMVQAYLDDSWIRPLPTWLRVMTGMTLTLLFCIMLLRLSPRNALLAGFGLGIAVFLAVPMLLMLGYWLPPTAIFVVLILAYPLWSWRRQEAALRFFDQEISRLKREPSPLPERFFATDPLLTAKADSQLLAADVLGDVLQTRIDTFQDALDRLRILRQTLADSLDGAPDPIMVCHPDGTILLVNPAARHWLRGSKNTKAIGRPALEVLLERLSDPGAHGAFEKLCQGDETLLRQGIEFRDHCGRDMILRGAQLNQVRHRLLGMLLMLTDISPLRQAERQREEALRFISHDMRSPQNSILALLELHGDAAHANAMPGPQLTAQIAIHAQRTLDLVDSFMRLARAESAPLALATIDLADMLDETCDNFWALAQARQVTLVSSIDLRPAFLEADPTLLMRAISNLIDNALKFSPQGGTVSIALFAANDEWIIRIGDQGPGIAAQDQLRLFQPFAQVAPEPGKTAPKGSGLGLAFVQKVAERHGGHCSIESQPGYGARFSIHLPAGEMPMDDI